MTVYEQLSGSRASYHYRIDNMDAERSIVQLWVGYDFWTDEVALTTPPAGWTEKFGIPAGSASSPIGWTVDAVRQEEASRYFVRWLSALNDPSKDIAPNQSSATFSVTLSARMVQYLTSRWVVFFDDGSVLDGRLEPRGSMDLPADLLGTMVVNGSPLMLHFQSLEQDARVFFYTDGQKRIRLSVTAPAPGTQILIRSPLGTITSRTFTADGVLDAVPPDAGDYHLYVNPPNTVLSAPTLRLVDVDLEAIHPLR